MGSFRIIRAKELEDSTKLYRYLSLSQFIEFIERKKTYMTNINYWEDTWEAPAGKFDQSGAGILDKDGCSHLKNLIGQSWSFLGISDALWRIYSRDKKGIMIQTSVGKFKLIRGIKTAMLAPVIYYNNIEEAFKEIKRLKKYNGVLGQGFLKRKAFQHEMEVRLITLNEEEYIENFQGDEKHILLDLDPISFIEAIIVDPRAKDWYVDTIRRYCARADISVMPIKSDLYSNTKGK